MIFTIIEEGKKHGNASNCDQFYNYK